MELRQLKYFVAVVTAGSMSRAAVELGLVQSALSQQIGRLESELSTRLLQRSASGVTPTAAGMAFFREAQLTLRHAEQAIRCAQDSRLSGSVSIGLAPTTSSMLGLPLMQAMRERYPDVRLHVVESLSGHLATMLNARQLDLAILFDNTPGRRWSVSPLLAERLFHIRTRRDGERKAPKTMRIVDLANQPLILPTSAHGLRSGLDAIFANAGLVPSIILEVDSLAMLMDAVNHGLGGTVQPAAALGRFPEADRDFHLSELVDAGALRQNLLCTLPEEELSPAALAMQVVVRDCVRTVVQSGRWRGASLQL
ncbi:LysR family transcriptional regulator [Pseudomonas matsuisoli]|uniref:LysR family transcriptional regulator n=1 Tax=Pseudomonas matsuisoli TaxID=1515666 RepID=A0A917PUP7_9PSED|nr:LysR substrate-binding domain-containing protein [Pseudomonas matsuisoli]GGJ92721.1 LysR family transcriptional regulator [Pseudomonas matsuisoli]